MGIVEQGAGGAHGELVLVHRVHVAFADRKEAFMKLRQIHILGAALMAGVAGAAAQEKGSPAASVPVKVVVLFSSGVGYFEHAGSVKDNTSTELRFKTQQINDILKSLVLQDLGGGKIATIVYPSHDPIAKTLRSFQVDITSNPSLA